MTQNCRPHCGSRSQGLRLRRFACTREREKHRAAMRAETAESWGRGLRRQGGRLGPNEALRQHVLRCPVLHMAWLGMVRAHRGRAPSVTRETAGQPHLRRNRSPARDCKNLLCPVRQGMSRGYLDRSQRKLLSQLC